MTSDTLLKVEHLSMKFGGLMAINDFSFEAKRGEITALIGPNGAGKTTVFNCITGFYKPTMGMITLTQKDGTQYLLERLPDFRITKEAKVARTFQNIRLFSGLTRAGEPAGRAAQQADEGIRLYRARPARPRRLPQGKPRSRSSLPSTGWKRPI